MGGWITALLIISKKRKLVEKSIEQEKDPERKIELYGKWEKTKLELADIEKSQKRHISLLSWAVIWFQFLITMVLFGIFFVFDVALFLEFCGYVKQGNSVLGAFNEYYEKGSARALLLLILVQIFIFSRKFGVSTTLETIREVKNIFKHENKKHHKHYKNSQKKTT